MADPGTNYTDNKQEQIERRLVKIYSEAQRDIKKQLSEHTAKFKATDKLKRQQLKEGKITQAEYNSWKQGQVFTGDRWREKLDSVTSSIHHANVMANGIVNGERRAVFGENATYQAYQLEHDAGMNLSFTVYDSGAVTRLLSGHPELLKRRVIDGKADRAWNKTIIANTIAKNIITGASIDKIAAEIAAKTALSNEKASVRYARTAMTGAQNAGRIAAMNDALDMGIKVKKLWIATLDERTRSAHAELDGKTAEVNEDFHNSLGAIGFPGDPKASDANVWNCRCTLGYEYEKYPSQNATRYDQESGKVISDMTYEEWKAWKSRGGSPQQPLSVRELTKEERLKELLQQDAPDVYEAGKLFADIIHEKYDALAGQELKALKDELDDLEFSYDNNAVIEARRMASSILRGLSDDSIFDVKDLLDGTKFADEVRGMDLIDLVDYLRTKETEIERRKNELRRMMANRAPTYKNSAAVLKETLSAYRTMGSDGLDVKTHLRNSSSPMRKVVEEAYSCYPRSWIEASINRGMLTPKKVDRGYYSDWQEIIAISGTGGDRSFATAIHELGHRFERAVPTIKDNEKQFYEKRTAGEELKWLGAGYSKDEITRKDNFLSAYMGKDYGGTAYELVSMGFQYAYTEPETLRKDPDMEQWIYGLLLTQ